MDFISDTLYNGKRLRTLNIVDDHNREGVAIEIDTSLSSPRVTRVLERLRHELGLPETIRLDNSPEFLGAAFVSYAEQQDITIQYIQPANPKQNAHIEPFNRTYREEVTGPALVFIACTSLRNNGLVADRNEERVNNALGGVPRGRYVPATEVSNCSWST